MATVTISVGAFQFTGSIPAFGLTRQEFAQAIVAGISGSFQANVGFQNGGDAPTTNIGPWLPEGETEFWFWDGTASKYYPGGVPPGTILQYGSDTPPAANRYLLCNGATVAQSAYPRLFTVIGHNFAWGTDDQTSLQAGGQFRLPDYRGRVPLGSMGQGQPNSDSGTNPLTAHPIGQRAGRQTNTLNQAQFPDTLDIVGYAYDANGSQVKPAVIVDRKYSGDAITAQVDNPDASDTDVNNLPPYQACAFIIRY